ncbi:hypothetical protein HDU67_009985 [Dinochytrium kinnereticum]|nr:hypothetical protein HDU67_009985 [Dinochytrium kinnereticum]
MTRGNQREEARKKAAKKAGDQKKVLTQKELGFCFSDAEMLRKKAEAKAAAAAAGGTDGASAKK